MVDRMLVNLLEYEEAAKESLDRGAYDWIAGGAGEEGVLVRNRSAYGSLVLRPRVLTGVSDPGLATTVLGTPLAAPIMVAPMGLQCLADPEGEVAMATGAARSGVLLVLSAMSSTTMEDVARQVAGPMWFQQYLYKDRDFTLELARRADRCGFRALCVTVDPGDVAKRERDLRNAYVLPKPVHYEGIDVPSSVGSLIDRTGTWADLAWFVGSVDLPVVVKGVMTGEDGELAVRAGASGVIVSNHGGRQLDGTAASVEVLPEVVRAVGGRAEVYLDGGVRRGTDVLKALACGARSVLVGRPAYWGLAVGGADGVADVLEILRDELRTAMVMVGAGDVRSVPERAVMTRAGLS